MTTKPRKQYKVKNNLHLPLVRLQIRLVEINEMHVFKLSNGFNETVAILLFKERLQ